MAWQDRLYGFMAGADPEWARQYQAAQRGELENQLVRQELQDRTQERELELKRREGLGRWNRAYSLVAAGRLKDAAPVLSEMVGFIPGSDSAKYQGVDRATGRPRIRLNDDTGEDEDIEIDNETALKMLQLARAALEKPEDYHKAAVEGMGEVSAYNQKSRQNRRMLRNGISYHDEKDLWGNTTYKFFDKEGNEVFASDRLPQTMKEWEDFKKAELGIEKQKTDIEQTKTATEENQARTQYIKGPQTQATLASAGASAASATESRARAAKAWAEVNGGAIDPKDVEAVMKDLDASIYTRYKNDADETVKNFNPLDDTQLRSKRANALARGLDIKVQVQRVSDDPKASTKILGYEVVPASQPYDGVHLPPLQRTVVGTANPKKQEQAPAKPKTTKQLTPQIAKQLLAQAGGDKNKARQLAARAGYSF